MRQLSPEAEQSIIKAATDAVDLVDEDGMDPSAALEKIAKEQSWGPNMIRLACRAYNTGRQTAKYASSTNILDKFAEFPLADAEQVISHIFPSKEAVQKAAVYGDAGLGVSREYKRPPSWLATMAASRKTASEQRMQKAASVVAKPAPRAQTAMEVYNEHQQLKSAAEAARSKAGQAYDRLTVAMMKLAGYFQQMPLDRMNFWKAAYVVNTYYGQHGTRLMQWVAEHNKQASIDPKPEESGAFRRKMASEAIRFDRGVAPYTLVEACCKQAKLVHKLRDEEKAAKDDLEKQAIDKLAKYVTHPKRVKRAANSLIPEPDLVYYDIDDLGAFLPHRQKTAAVAEKQARAEVKEIDLLDGIKLAGLPGEVGRAAMGVEAKNLFDGLFSVNKSPAQVQDAYLDLEDPDHDSQLRQIRSQAMLSDFMNDEELSSYPPEQLLKAYNEISQMAPRIAMQPLAMRSLLKQHLQGHMAPHEVGQINVLESGHMGTFGTVPEHMMPYSPQMKPEPPSAVLSAAPSSPSLRLSPAAKTKTSSDAAFSLLPQEPDELAIFKF